MRSGPLLQCGLPTEGLAGPQASVQSGRRANRCRECIATAEVEEVQFTSSPVGCFVDEDASGCATNTLREQPLDYLSIYIDISDVGFTR